MCEPRAWRDVHYHIHGLISVCCGAAMRGDVTKTRTSRGKRTRSQQKQWEVALESSLHFRRGEFEVCLKTVLLKVFWYIANTFFHFWTVLCLFAGRAFLAVLFYALASCSRLKRSWCGRAVGRSYCSSLSNLDFSINGKPAAKWSTSVFRECGNYHGIIIYWHFYWGFFS